MADEATALTPAAPSGWKWFPVADTYCRDGSPLGVFVHFNGASDQLVIYFEGGGVCMTGGFCNFNPPHVGMRLGGSADTFLHSSVGAIVERQQPGIYTTGPEGIFDHANADNPFGGWNMVYIPYCSGDLHFGTRPLVSVPASAALRADMPQEQQFLGYSNTRKVIARVAGTFAPHVGHVVVAGTDAGGFGALLNFSMIADSFAGAQVDAIADSGFPLPSPHGPTCLLNAWRDLFGFDAAFPPDCVGCAGSNGGLFGLIDFILAKHPASRIAFVSSTEDDMVRTYFAPGQNNCATAQTADPIAVWLGLSAWPAYDFGNGLQALRTRYQTSGRVGTYFFGGSLSQYHQHLSRNRFYQSDLVNSLGPAPAEFVVDFLGDQVDNIGP